MTSTRLDDTWLRETLERTVDLLDVTDPVEDEPAETIALRRARRGSLPGSPNATVSLVRVDGVLRWTYQRAPRAVGPRRARRVGTLVGADQVFSHSFREVPPNKIVEKLEQLDQKLTPNQGLRRWENGALVPMNGAAPAQTPRALLIIHGTFSKSDGIFDELQACDEGKAFLAQAVAHYKQVLAGHRTDHRISRPKCPA